MKKSPKVLIVYRNNDLFSKWIPKIVEILQSLGKGVITQIFPIGTEGSEIEKWGEENYKLFDNVELITDKTCSYDMLEAATIEAGDEDGWDDGYSKTLGLVRYWELDSFIGNCIETGIFNSLYSSDGAKTISLIIERIMKDSCDAKPKKVVIFSPNMSDHKPFGFGFCYSPSESSERTKERRGNDKKIANIISEIFVKSGFLKVEVVEKFESSMDSPDNWIVLDRHYQYDLEKSLGRIQTKSFGIPIGSFYDDAVTQGLINVGVGELEEAIIDALKEKCGGGR